MIQSDDPLLDVALGELAVRYLVLGGLLAVVVVAIIGVALWPRVKKWMNK